MGSPVAGRAAARAGGADRLLRQHPGAAAPTWRASRPSASCWGGCARTALAALAHQELPFERLVEELAPEREPRPQPALPGDARGAGDALRSRGLPGLTLRRPGRWRAATAKFDLSLELAPEGRGARRAGSNTAATSSSAATVERLAGHLGTLLAAAVADAGARLSALPLLTAAERAQMLAAWRRSAGRWTAPGTLPHGLFEEQARLQPEAVALVPATRRMSYGELARRAPLARSLRRLGVGPEVRVGLAAERSPELVVGILGILRGGRRWCPSTRPTRGAAGPPAGGLRAGGGGDAGGIWPRACRPALRPCSCWRTTGGRGGAGARRSRSPPRRSPT